MHSPLPVLGRGEPERYDSPAQVAGDLNVSLLGALARADTVRGPLALPDLIDPEAHYDAVADRIQLLAGQMPLKLLGVIGLGDDPLRFRLAANLAGRLAANGRQVTIVEAELGGPVLRHDRARREGLLDMLLYGCSFAAVGRESGIRGVKLVSAGSHPWSGEPIHGDEWERVLGALRHNSDFTLVTTTTGLPAPILGMLARRLDSIVIAYALHWSGREAVRRSYLALWDMDAPILGLVTEGPHAALASASAVAAQGSASRGREREIAPLAGTPRPQTETGEGAASESSGHAAPPRFGAQWARRLLGDSVEEMPPITDEVEVVIRQTSEVDAASAALWEKEVDRLRSIIAAPDGVTPFADPEAERREAPVPEWQAPPLGEAPEAPASESQASFSAEATTPPPLPPLPEVLHREAIPSGGNALPGEHIQITYDDPSASAPLADIPVSAPLPEVHHPAASAPLPEVLHREASPASGSVRPEEHIQITFEPPSGGGQEAAEVPERIGGGDPLPEVLKREAVPPPLSPSSADGKIDIVVDRMFGLSSGSPAASPSGTGERRTIPLAIPGVPKPLEPAPAPPPLPEKEIPPVAPVTPEMSSDAALDAAFDLTSDFLSDTPPSAALEAAFDAIPEIPAEKTAFAAPDADVLDDDALGALASPPAVSSVAPSVFEPEPFIETTGPGRESSTSSLHVKPEVTLAAEATPVAGDDTAADLPWLRPEPAMANDSTDFLEAPFPRRAADREGVPSSLAGLTRSELEREPASVPDAGARVSMPMSPFPSAGTPAIPSGPATPADTFAEPQFPEPAGATEQAMALDQQVIEAIEEELVGAQATARTAAPTPVHKNRTPWRVLILGSLVGLAAVVFMAYRSGAIRLEPRPPRPGTVATESMEPALTPDPAATDVVPVGEDPIASPTPHAAVEAPPEPALDLPGGDEPLASQVAGEDLSTQPAPVTANDGMSESPAPAAPPAPVESAKTPPVAEARKTEASDVRVVGEAPRGFGVHVGSFRTPAFAQKDLARFTGRGYSGLLVEVAVPGKGMWQRVVLGPYPTWSGAEEVAAEVRAAGLSPKAQSMSLKP